MLLEGMRWRIGNDRSVKIWGEQWLPALINNKVRTPRKLFPENTGKVH